MSLQGKRNLYLCEKCGLGFTTIDADEGVTPMLTTCRAKPECNGTACSFFYKVPQDWFKTNSHEWYRPSEEEAAKSPPHVREHVQRGGLLLRPAARAGERP